MHNSEGQSVTRPPYFDGEDHQFWKMQMECFLRSTDFHQWQERADVWWASLLRTRFEDGAIEVAWDEFVRLFRAKFIPEHIQDRMEQEFLSLTQSSMTRLGKCPTVITFTIPRDNSEDNDDEAMLSRRLQGILAKKKKYGSKRYFKKDKNSKEPTCYEWK
ncbi:hypothetical protein Taro_002476 [Colocasia esculenta]|uniref:Retrotransposon gag domain-containing protein n=1 Tax=Colocasia esculenta TaxID=4460 RepID=A0A843TKY9_COLES|nr:hypothetical protein [Colocasia esculenta]